MKKVVLFYVELSHYRLPILDRLAKHCDLTIVYSKGALPDRNYSFKTVQVPLVEIGPFFLFKIKGFFCFLKSFDVVIGLMDLRLLQFMLLCFIKKKYKLALWGIGVSGSYTKKFNAENTPSKLRTYIASHADALIFYSSVPVEKFLAKKFNPQKMYIAHNTIDNIVPMNLVSKRDIILFVGTLYKAKGVEDLIESYFHAYRINPLDLPKLVIVGGGELFQDLKSYVVDIGLENNIELTGPIYDGDKLKAYFERAIFAVSPQQAGLSVLTSMSYGVPFVTCKDANTGGEILNIINGFNGYLLDSTDDFVELFSEASSKLEVFKAMGVQAFDYYREKRSPDVMAGALIKCIEDF
ncbi:glycosyltransferase family 4 protein [Shewanella sp. SP1S2-4]|uniref:glycosyltransferase family 4 protein n=1 Tax=Shewanella sp. SP1S2-4 TaxID=3063537 RepID=UPI00288D507B|nr:glycosyltransferase family 4 protein [Shewanella sp. SP1S2-4]MDT3322092.1 glycosyltransferase family 4 protein [Shewanella sp. SP1S2-4]